jgi:hypothetical protein
MHAVHAIVEVLDTLAETLAACHSWQQQDGPTWAVLGGKNSNEKVVFPSAWAWRSFSEICMAANYHREVKERKENAGNYSNCTAKSVLFEAGIGNKRAAPSEG